VQGIGVVVLIIAWSIIGYMIAFNGKTMKDMMNPMIGSTIAGLAPVLVGWLFS
jgi:mannitol-specific phosphotransferase system IIBC component